MKQIFPDLWQTKNEHPFPGVQSNAYLLTRDGGNILFYGTGAKDEIPHIQQLGGVSWHYLSHRHEAGPSLATIKEAFGSKLCCDKAELQAISKFCPVDLVFNIDTPRLDGLQIIPTPGHTSGSTCFVYQSPHGEKYLFTGDTLYPKEDSWGTLVFPSDGGSKAALKSTLEMLGELEPDVVIASAHQSSSAFTLITGTEWRAIAQQAAAKL
ncbi:MBL fold metallo-hydrolase [Noviherbaspirillum massiliense]|uniref:MBL fold metallo-hydrolase n=1 Tax=Noviherbaspirillum massiliense TaxID=1465823 RepID=UPI00036C3C7E|nr:MBL fold metallo-hydrolase [Noviherbaspirillum massiliense]